MFEFLVTGILVDGIVFVVFATVFTLIESAVFHTVELDWTRFDGLVKHVVIYLADAVGTAFIAVAVAVSYYEFRVVKESTDIDQVAVVFD